MADVTQTAANVTIKGTVVTEQVTFGQTIEPGDFLYQLAADQEYYNADVDASEAAAQVKGMAITDGGDGEIGIIVKSGDVDVGGTLAAGTAYVASDTPGGIKPSADLGVGDYITHLGYAIAPDTLRIAIKIHGVAL